MATLTLKNVPDALYSRLKARASRNHRSLNREAIHCLETSVAEQATVAATFDPQAFLQEVRRTRTAMAERGVWLTEEVLQSAIEDGRP